MKLLFLLCWSLCLQHPVKTNRELFDDFHTIYENRDFDKMRAFLADDFTGIDLDENNDVVFRKADYVQYMVDWNATFDTKWNVEKVWEEAGLIKSIEYDTDVFNYFFYDGKKVKIEYTYRFVNDKLKVIKMKDLPETVETRKIFSQRFGDFYRWVQNTHPLKADHCRRRDKTAAVEIKALLKEYTSAPSK